MSENPRIEELRRRVHKDPASIAFAQLAEEHRRAGNYDEAARVCSAGLERHPSYLSARVTLGRSLIELERYDEARTELEYVLRSAPENLAAIRGMAEIHQRRGELTDALRQYQTALAIAKHDPELEESVHDLSRQLAAGAAAASIPIDIIAAAPEREASTPAVRREPLATSPTSSSTGLDEAADEFTRAMQALDALSLDVPATSEPPPPPAPPLPAAPFVPPLPEPAAYSQPETVVHPEPEPVVYPQPEPDIDVLRAPEPAADVPVPEIPLSTGELAVVNELESWLDAIELDRGETKREG